MNHLPSTQALRVFEAVARHNNLTRASKELNLTPAGTGFQIKSLENFLGVTLFAREGSVLRLTEMGKAYLPEVTKTLRSLRVATAKVARSDTANVVTVLAPACFASHWLVPRLGRFLCARSKHEIRIENAIDDPALGQADIIIRYAPNNSETLEGEHAVQGSLFPVCSPAFLESLGAVTAPSHLAAHTVIHSGLNDEDWARWLAAVDAVDVAPRSQLRFRDVCLALQAARCGQGIAMGRSVLCAADLASGSLVSPLPRAVPDDFSYFVALAEDASESGKAKAFYEWLLSELDGDESEAEASTLRAKKRFGYG